MKAAFNFNPAKFYAATARLAEVPGSPPTVQVMKGAAGQVIRKVIDVTPPAKGKADSNAKKRGEAAISKDLALTMAVAAKGLKKAARDLKDPKLVHHLARDPRTGRANKKGRAKAVVAKAELTALKKALFAKVGHLAAGWNKAAAALGVRVPAWIKRHGDKYGIIKIEVTENRIRITIGNAVNFVDNIEDLDRRLQWALDSVARSIIEKQIPAIIRRAGKKAGFSVR